MQRLLEVARYQFEAKSQLWYVDCCLLRLCQAVRLFYTGKLSELSVPEFCQILFLLPKYFNTEVDGSVIVTGYDVEVLSTVQASFSVTN